MITIDGNKTVFANFSYPTYSFPAATISPTGSGTVTKSPNATSYNYGVAVTVTATPATGWVFDRWEGSCTGTVNPCVVTVDGAESVTAYFINSAYPNVLRVEQTIGGTVTPNPTGGSYADGTPVTLTTTPATGYTFGQWNDDCAGQANPCSLIMNSSKRVSATFNQTTFTLTVAYSPMENGGTTIPAAGVNTYGYGTVVNVFAYPLPGYKFNGWGGSCSGTGNCSLTMTANRSVTANFAPVYQNLTIAVNPVDGGTTSPAVGINPYLEGSVVEVTALPAAGYEFAQWNGACSGMGSCMVTMDSSKSVTAVFAHDVVDLAMSINGSGKVIRSLEPPYYPTDQVTLTADPDPNWSFLEWSGDCVGQGNPCTLAMDVDKQVTATFVQVTCALPQNLNDGPGVLREDFKSMSGWTVSGSAPGFSAVIDTANHKVGNASIQLTTPSSSGYVGIKKTVNWDLSSPDQQGNIRFWVYVHGTSEPTGFQVYMYNSNQNNGFYASYGRPFRLRYRPGWNLVSLRTSDWYQFGSPSWGNPITSIYIKISGVSATSYSIDGLESGKSIPAVLLTFDDGHSTLWDQAYAYMEPRNVRGTGYIISNYVNTIGKVTWAQLQEMYATGWTIGNHSANHTDLTTLSLSGQEAELAAARDALNAYGITTGGHVAYPYGKYNANTLTAMTNLGMQSGRTTLYFNNLSPLTSPYEIGLQNIASSTTLEVAKGYVDTAMSRGEILVLLLHDISENPTANGWYTDRFQNLVDYIISKGVPILTMDELIRLQSGNIRVPQPINGSCWDVVVLDEYTLTVNSAHGVVTKVPDQATYTAGTDVVLTMGAVDSGWTFSGWNGGGCTGTDPCTVTMNSDTIVTADFTQNTYALTVTANPVGSGIVTKSPDTATYPSGTTVTLTPVPAEGRSFSGWSGANAGELVDNGNGTWSIVMNEAKTVSATFELSAVTLMISPVDGGAITATPPGLYHYGDVVTVQALPDEGHSFTGWTGDLSGMTNPTTITLNGNRTIGATFGWNAVTLTIQQSTGGTITATPAGPYQYGDVVAVQAAANTGYNFTSWTGDLVGTTNPTMITLDEDKVVGATFTRIEYTLTTDHEGSGFVLLDKEPPYYYGEVVHLTASPSSGWSFGGWSGDISGNTNPVSITIDGNKSVKATFTEDWYTLEVILDPVGSGHVDVNPPGPYRYHAMPLLTAYPNPGWTFVNWTGDREGTANPIEVTVNYNSTVYAHFAPIPYTFTTSVVGQGTISKSPEKATYTYGEEVTVTPTSAAGWSFDHWNGSCTGSGVCVVTVDGNENVEATFQEGENSLDVTVVGSGTVIKTPNQETYINGAIVILNATADLDWKFTGWSGDVTSTENPLTITMDGAKSVTATFTQNTYNLTVVSDHGIVNKEPDQPAYLYGTPVLITMGTVESGYTFAGWDGGGCTGTAPCTVSVTADTTVTADFTQSEYTLSITRATGGMITAAPEGPYHYGDAVTLTADPDDGYTFTGWFGDVREADNPVTITMIGDRVVSATFTQDMYALTINQVTGGTITVSPDGLYHYGDVVTVEAKADANYTFTGWTGDLSGTTSPTTVTIDDNKTVGAIFDVNVVNLTLTQTVGGTITAHPAGPYHYGEEVTLTATPDTGYNFTGWMGDASGTTNPTTITLNGDKAITATYELQVVTLTITQATGGTITAIPGGTYHYGDVVTVEAFADTGYTFSGWTGDLSGTTSPATLILNGNKTVGAAFELLPPICYTLTLSHTGEGSDPAVSPVNSTGCAAGSYVAGEAITLSGAIPTAGYQIDSWTGTADDTSKAATNIVSMPAANHTVQVNYTLSQYTLTVTAGAGGTATKTPEQATYHLGDKVTLTATASMGYTFEAWTGDYSGTTNPVEITVNGNLAIAATFTQNTYTLTVEAVNGAVTKNPDQPTYIYGEMVELTATPAEGYSFTGWTGDLESEVNPVMITMDGNKTVSVTFELIPPTCYALTLSHIGNGSDPVASPTNSEGCTIGTYLAGASITLSATPDTGWKVSGWTGTTNDSSMEATNTVTMPASAHAAAVNYVRTQYTLTVTQQDGGTITPATAIYDYGTVVPLTANPAEGHHFVAWTGECTGGGECSVTMDADKTVSATFAHDIFTLTVNQSTGGTITPPTADYDYGTVVELTAAPDSDHHFAAWTGACSVQTGLTCRLTVTGNLAVGATFELTPVCYTLTLGHTGEGSNPFASPISSTGCAAGQYLAGEHIDLSQATPIAGYEIGSWTGTADDTSKASTNALIMPANDHAVAINYLQSEYTLKVISEHGAPEIDDQAPYHYGDTLTITMGMVDAGWTFTGWSGAECTGTGPCTVTITDNTTVTAAFTDKFYALTLEVAGQGTVAKDPDATTYLYGTQVTLTPTPAAGWSFSSWSGACTGSEACVVTMEDNKSVTATFTQNDYTLTVEVVGQGTVVKEPDQATYYYGVPVRLMATADPGWTFIGWSGGGCSGTDPCSVTIMDNITVTANFSQDAYSMKVSIDPADSGNNVTISNPGPYIYGDPVTLTTVVAVGWQFDHWVVGETSVTDNPLIFNITDNMVVTAYFTKIPYTLTITSSPSEGGTVTADQGNPVYYNDQVTVTTAAALGYTFSHWEGACTGSEECVVTITTNTSVTAVFTQEVYTLTINKNGSGSVSADKQPPYHYGDLVTLTTAADLGWTFTGWDGICTGNGDCQVSMTDNTVVAATFTQNAYTLDVTILGQGAVTKVPEQTTYHYGDVVTLTETPAPGYIFTGWTNGVKSIETSVVITLSGNTEVTANFVAQDDYDAPCSVAKLVYAIRIANFENSGTTTTATIWLDAKTTCIYTVLAPAEIDQVYGPVGLPVITSSIRLRGYTKGATITYAPDFPLLVVTENGELILKNVSIIPTSTSVGATGEPSGNSLVQPSIEGVPLESSLQKGILKGVVIGGTGSVDMTTPAFTSLVLLNAADEDSTPAMVSQLDK